MEESAIHLGRIGVPGNPPNAFIAYVRIPNGTTREQYVRHCMTTNTVSLLTVNNENYHRVHIGDNELQQVIFPKDDTEVGSPVLCVTIPVNNVPIVATVLKHINAPQTIFKELSKRIMLQDEATYVDIQFNGQSGTADVALNSGSTDTPTSIRLLNQANKALLSLDVQGSIDLQADDLLNLAMLNGFSLTLGANDKTKLLSLLPAGLTYTDDFNNKLTVNENGLVYSYNGTSQRALLGEDTVTFMKDWLNALMKVTVPTFAGPSGIPINTPEFQALVVRADTLLSQYTKLA